VPFLFALRYSPQELMPQLGNRRRHALVRNDDHALAGRPADTKIRAKSECATVVPETVAAGRQDPCQADVAARDSGSGLKRVGKRAWLFYFIREIPTERSAVSI
jgi:hypothetical protein